MIDLIKSQILCYKVVTTILKLQNNCTKYYRFFGVEFTSWNAPSNRLHTFSFLI